MVQWAGRVASLPALTDEGQTWAFASRFKRQQRPHASKEPLPRRTAPYGGGTIRTSRDPGAAGSGLAGQAVGMHRLTRAIVLNSGYVYSTAKAW